MPITSVRRRSAVRLAAVAAGLSTAATLAVVSSPANAVTERGSAAPRITSVAITGAKSVTSSKHKALKLSAYASRSASGSSVGSFGVSLAAGGESHTWNFNVPRSAIALTSTGKGKIVVPATSIAPFGKVKLTAVPKGATTISKCHGTAIGKSRKVTLSGTFWFDTRSGAHGWGSVGSKTKKFAFKVPAMVTWTYAGNPGYCGPTDPDPSTCRGSSAWTGMSGTQFVYGDLSTSRKVTAIRSVKFTKPRNATRSDLRQALVKSVSLTRDNDTGSFIVTGDGGATKGTLTVPELALIDQTVPCGTSNQATLTSAYGQAVNGTTPFAVYDIFGGIGVANGSLVSVTKTVPLA